MYSKNFKKNAVHDYVFIANQYLNAVASIYGKVTF